MRRSPRHDPTSTFTLVLALGCALLGFGWSGWRAELRAQGYYYGNALTLVTQPGSDLDVGWTGIGHDASGVAGMVVTADLACPTDASCSCSLDGSALVDGPLGAPLPMSAGGVPICVFATFREAIVGDYDCTTGCLSARVQLGTRFFLSASIDRPCPTCEGDPTPGDGVKAGFCNGGATPGAECDAGGIHPDFGATSSDCVPAGSSVGEPDLDLNPLTTGTTSLSAAFDCLSSEFPAGSCHCENQVQPNACFDQVCPESGVCENGPIDGVCDQRTFLFCRPGTGTEDCEDVFPGAGTCVDRPRPCFGDTITRSGVCGTEAATLASIFCLDPTRSAAVNTVLGLPGPVAVSVPVGAVVIPAATPTPGGPTPASTPSPAVRCGNGAIEQDEQCDDGNADDGDCCSSTCQVETGSACNTCAASPFTGCRELVDATRSLLLIQDAPADRRDELAWRWMAGDETPATAFGDPRTSEGFALCGYAAAGAAPSLVLEAAIPAGATCKGEPCWRSVSSDGGYRYRDRDGTAAGIMRVQLEPGAAGRTAITVKGGGANLPLPTLPLELPVVVQLRATNGECWQASYGSAGTHRNDARRFRGTSGP